MIDNARDWLLDFEQAVAFGAYNCDCQVGGVDAMSIDTDYLQYGIRLLKEALKEDA